MCMEGFCCFLEGSSLMLTSDSAFSKKTFILRSIFSTCHVHRKIPKDAKACTIFFLVFMECSEVSPLAIMLSDQTLHDHKSFKALSIKRSYIRAQRLKCFQ